MRDLHDIYDGGFRPILFGGTPPSRLFTTKVFTCRDSGWCCLFGIALSLLSRIQKLDGLYDIGMLHVSNELSTVTESVQGDTQNVKGGCNGGGG